MLTFWNISLDLFLTADGEVLRLICERSSQIVSDLRRSVGQLAGALPTVVAAKDAGEVTIGSSLVAIWGGQAGASPFHVDGGSWEQVVTATAVTKPPIAKVIPP